MAGKAAAPAGDAGKTGGKPAKPKTKPPPQEKTQGEPREKVHDELMLKFAGTATLIVGLVLLVASTLAIAALSILNANIERWLIIVPLSLIIIGVGAAVAGHYRRVVNAILHPKPPAPVQPAPQPYGYAYPYAYPYAPRPVAPAAPPYAAPRPVQPAPPGGQARPYPPAYPYYGAPAPQPVVRTCVACGRRIPQDSRFCPFCRHVFA